MKKIRFLALALVGAMTLSLLLASCGGKKEEAKNVPVADLMSAVTASQELPKLMDLDDDTLASVYGMNVDDLEEYASKFPVMNVHATEIFIAKVKEGKMEDVKAVLEARQQTLVEQWSWYLPEQLELVENYKLVTEGNYVLFAVCEDPDAAVNAFTDALK